MAISLLGTPVTNGQDAGGTNTVNFDLVAGSNRIVIAVSHHYRATYDISGFTIGGNAMTAVSNPAVGTYRKLSAWYLLEAGLPSNGTKSCVATYAGSVAQSSIAIFSIQDAKQEAPIVDTTPFVDDGAPTVSTVSLTTLADLAWIFSCAASETNVSFTHGTGQSELIDYPWNGSVKSGLTVSYEEIATAGSNTQTDTASSGDRMTGIGFSFAPVASVNTSGMFALLGS